MIHYRPISGALSENQLNNCGSLGLAESLTSSENMDMYGTKRCNAEAPKTMSSSHMKCANTYNSILTICQIQSENTMNWKQNSLVVFYLPKSQPP